MREILIRSAEEIERAFEKKNVRAEVYVSVELGFVVVQIPGCDDLRLSSRKFLEWKSRLDEECEKAGLELLVTDTYALGKDFKKIR